MIMFVHRVVQKDGLFKSMVHVMEHLQRKAALRRTARLLCKKIIEILLTALQSISRSNFSNVSFDLIFNVIMNLM